MTLEFSCPLPTEGSNKLVRMAHGGGGRAMHDLLEHHILPACPGHQQQDSAVLEIAGRRLAFTTDSYVIDPLFFPGGDIGTLAVNGTVNDLAMVGAAPHSMSLALVIEEGFEIPLLDRVMDSVASAAQHAGIRVVTGDTKVVERGHGDGLYINTSGIGCIETRLDISAGSIRSGDAILLSGDLGRHGIAVMAARQSPALETELGSCCAPLWGQVQALLDAGIEIHCQRDLTRGGLASALNELAQATAMAMEIREADIPVGAEVQAVCEILGLDPLYVANEGRFVIYVPQDQAHEALAVLQTLTPAAAIIGEVESAPPAQVVLQNILGVRRHLPMLSGEQLPRIC